MSIVVRLGQSARHTRFPALLLLGVAAIWGLFRTAHVLHLHWMLGANNGHDLSTHDLYTYYSVWFVLGHRDCADIALRESLYLPHTWLFFTPFFILGWPTGRILFFLINVGAVFYIWWRLSHLVGLQGIQRWLLLSFFWSWSATGNVIGLGNLALICLAAVLAAYPFTSQTGSLFLALSAMKQSLVFPLYFQLLFKRPKVLILPFVVFALCGLATLWWTRLSITESLGILKAWVANVSSWTTADHTCLRRPLSLFIKTPPVLSVVVWVTWFALFGVTARWIKDPLAQLAALLLLCLLPMYHNAYDMVAAVPALAIFMKRCPLVWPALMTLALALDPFRQMSMLVPAGPLRELCLALQSSYLPVLILAFIGGLLYLEISASHRQETNRHQPQVASTLPQSQP